LKNKDVLKKVVFIANRVRCPICDCYKFTYISSSDATVLKHGIGRTKGAGTYFTMLEKGIDDRFVMRIKKPQVKVSCDVFIRMCNDCGEMVKNVRPNNPVFKYDRKRR
jgi:hypothetical protein